MAALTLVLAWVPSACGGIGESDSSTVRVLAAASLTDAFEDVAARFEDARPGVDVTLSFGGSTALAQQVLDGAPADVLATADEPTMGEAGDDGAVDGRPEVFARNRLVLAVPAGNPAGITALADLARSGPYVGLCAVEVPCGALAAEALDASGVEASVDSYEPDVRSLLTKLVEGELDAGLVYATDAAAASSDVEVVAVPGLDQAVTRYPVAVLTSGGNRTGARDFVAFLLGPEGQQILTDHGFTSP